MVRASVECRNDFPWKLIFQISCDTKQVWPTLTARHIKHTLISQPACITELQATLVMASKYLLIHTLMICGDPQSARRNLGIRCRKVNRRGEGETVAFTLNTEDGRQI